MMARFDGRKDPDLVKAIVEAIKGGLTYKDACGLAKIGQTTFHRWMDEGLKESRIGYKRAFWEQVKKAELQAKQRNIEIIQKAAEKSWQAAAWFLERRYPHEFGKMQRIDIATPYKPQISSVFKQALDKSYGKEAAQ